MPHNMNKKIKQFAVLQLPLFILSHFFYKPVYCQVYGCTDPLANNYNPAATVNNGSCSYNATIYAPPVKVDPLSDVIIETSGLQMAGGFLWTFNDSGGEPALYRIDTLTNAVLQKVLLAGATNMDWEDIAFDGTYFYIGDFGNNANGARTNLKIYKFPFTSIADHITNPIVTIAAGEIEQINFVYNDQPQPPVVTTANNTKFDCEAMIVDAGKIHLFTKNWIDINTTHYVINGIAPGNYIAMPVDTLATNYLVTAADRVPGKKMVCLLGYQNTGTALHYIHLLSDYSGGKYFNGNKRKIELQNVLYMGQAEGIAFRNETYAYISSEKFTKNGFTVNQKLLSIFIGGLVSSLAVKYEFIGDGNWDIAGNWSNMVVPPANLNTGSEIYIDPAPGGKCVLNTPYILSPSCLLNVSPGKFFIIEGNFSIHN